MMRRLVPLLLVLVLVPAAPGGASDPALGVGEQQPRMFSSPWYEQLQIRHARFLVAWDALHYKWQRDEADRWMAEAQRTGTEVLLAFGRSRGPGERRHRVLPSVKRYVREFRAFRKRYPFVENFIPWNEANHCSQPLCHQPERAAAYFDALRSACPKKCTILAADVLDHVNMVEWLRRFKCAVRHAPRIWGLHNYIDANRFRTSGTRTMLRTVRGKIWFTETGGLVFRDNPTAIPFRHGVKHAERATRQVFRLAKLSPRITRVYLYHWAPSPNPASTWDSALTDRRGRMRPALLYVSRWVRAARARAAPEAARRAR